MCTSAELYKRPPAKIRGLSSRYHQLPHIAFAFILTRDCPRAFSSALLCLMQRSSLTIPVVSVVCACSGTLTRATMRLAGHTAVLGAGGSLIIRQPGVLPAGAAYSTQLN